MALVKLDNKKTFNYLYEFKIEFFVPKTKISIKPSRIVYVCKDNIYMTNMFPTLKMELIINKKDLFILQEHQTEVLANINLLSYKYNSNSEASSSDGEKMGTLTETKIELNETFEPIFEKNTFNSKYRTEEYEDDRTFDSKDPTANTVTETMGINIMVDFYSIKGISMNKSLFNAVLADTNVGTALLYILNGSGVNKAIVDAPVNDHDYDNIIIPPHNLRAAIEDLHARYGLYENGILLYFDFDTLYVLDRFAQNHECEKKESDTTTIQIREGDIIGKPLLDIQDSDNNDLIYDTALHLVASDESVASGEIDGNMFMFSNYFMGINSVNYSNEKVNSAKAGAAAAVLKRNISTHASSGDKVILDYDELNNPYNMASYFNTMETLKNIYSCSFKGACLSTFKPNKLLKLVFENVTKDNKFGGSYTTLRNLDKFLPTGQNNNLMMCNVDVTIARKSI